MSWPTLPPITRQRPKLVPDAYQPGGPGRPDWSDPEEIQLCGLMFAPATTGIQHTIERAATRSGAALYGEHPHLDVRSGDRLVLPSGTWSVTGDPERWGECGDGWPGGIVIPIERVSEGAR